jgi:hypothetical protein
MTPTQLELGYAGAEQSASHHGALLARLAVIAQELAQRAGVSGVTISDVRLTAGQRGILIPSPAHFLGTLMRKAGLTPTDRWRASDVAGSHGTSHRVWLAGSCATGDRA